MVVRVEAVFSNPQIHRLDGDALAYPPYIPRSQPFDDHIGAITMGATQIALVGEANANGEGHAAILLWAKGARVSRADDPNRA
jgi:hypothetical protein